MSTKLADLQNEALVGVSVYPATSVQVALSADVAGAAFTAVTASNNVQTITFERTKRYLRHFRTTTGTSPTFPLGVVIGEQKKSI